MATTQIKKGDVTKDIHDHRLPSSLGTAGQMLAMNSDGDAIEWQTPTSAVTSVNGRTGAVTGLAEQTDMETALDAKEATSNKVTTISSSSTDTQYPSAKCVYDLVGNIESLLLALL